jgi:putative membrane protein
MPLLAHVGAPLAPHDLWGAWNLAPTLLLGLGLVVAAYRRGRRRGPSHPGPDWRARWFAGALVALAVGLVSPLDALAGALASAHMVQHVLLVLVAAPLLALSAPTSTVLRGSPLAVRRGISRWRRRLRATGIVHACRQPIVVWVLHVATLWFWHASVPYDAAVRNEVLHALEHATFLATGVLFWRTILGARGGPTRVTPGYGVLLVFTMAMQSALLSALMTFSPVAWYTAYSTTTGVWGLDPLADQQLAGAIMWVPASLIYLAVGLGLVAVWLQASEREGAVV